MTADSGSPAIGDTFASIDDALADVREDRMIIVLDDDGRENEGDLIMAAEGCREADVAFMRRYGVGSSACR